MQNGAAGFQMKQSADDRLPQTNLDFTLLVNLAQSG